MAVTIRRKATRMPPAPEPLAPETPPLANTAVVSEALPPKTLADVIDLLSQNSTLAARRRRDLMSACNGIARLAGRAPHDLPADVAALRDLIASLHPAQGRISRKRFTNIRADLAAALEATGIIPPSDPACERCPAWKDFLERATQKHHAIVLSRFVRYCTHREIEPATVTDAVMSEFRTWLDARILMNQPVKIAKDTAVGFNAIVKRAGLDIPLLSTTMAPRQLARRLDIYPVSMTADIERYLKRLAEPDLFSDDGPLRSLRPTSLRNIEAHIRQTLDAAVNAGYPPSHFRTLADLIDIDIIRAAVDEMMRRRNGKIPSGLGNALTSLLSIARHYVKAPTETVKALELAKGKIGKALGNDRPSMSLKSQRRMDQFEDRVNIARLANLPLVLMKRADQAASKKSAAHDAMLAAAIAVLLCAPMRIKNLATLHMTEDLTLFKKGRNMHILLHIAADKTKGRQAIDAEIELPYATLITRYISHHRKQCATSSGDWLFPAQSGGPRDPAHFGGLIKQRIFRETGLVVNAHLFRHFSAYVFLEAHPGAYEDVRRVVGHAKMDTTTSFYAPASSKAAFRRYGEVLRNVTDGKLRK